MGELLSLAGYEKAPDYRTADICVINSCTVTATGDAKCRKYINRVRRENPTCIIALCGCMPQAFADQTEIFDGCDIVTGNTGRREIVPIIEEYLQNRRQLIRITPHEKGEEFEPLNISGFESRTRAYIKIQDGCNRFCTYCIIPYARGRVRSKPLDVLRTEATELAFHGYREIVLVGINLSAYGQDEGLTIFDAVKAVCDIKGIERVRLGSIEPERMTREILLQLSGEEKFCPHFHISLQSGCDETLRRMRRHYDTAAYERIVNDIRRIFDNPSVTTDVMVGFVSESEEEFNASLAFCDKIGFARTHVFPYSRRKGTVADRMEGHLDERIKHKRADVMIAHMAVCRRRFLLSQVGTVASVLVEGTTKDGYAEGYSKNYTRVQIPLKPELYIQEGQIINVLLVKAEDDHCVGEVLK